MSSANHNVECGENGFCWHEKKIPTKVHLPKLGLGLYDLEPHSLGTKNTEYKFLSVRKRAFKGTAFVGHM